MGTADTTLPQVEVATRAALRAWLEAHHAASRGIWLVTRKRSAGGALTWDDIVEEALCFGWIDSLPRALDAERTMLRLTPRRPKSAWSAKNKAHVARLEATGLMHASGAAVVAAARASGTFDALDAVSALLEPAELTAALDAAPPARTQWEAFPPSIRRGILEWIATARRPETRAARIQETATEAQAGRRANQWRPARGQGTAD